MKRCAAIGLQPRAIAVMLWTFHTRIWLAGPDIAGPCIGSVTGCYAAGFQKNATNAGAGMDTQTNVKGCRSDAR